jgi:hypothetical protein
VLNMRQERKTIGKLRRRFYWLRKEYGKTQKQVSKRQTRLKLAHLP